MHDCPLDLHSLTSKITDRSISLESRDHFALLFLRYEGSSAAGVMRNQDEQIGE